MGFKTAVAQEFSDYASAIVLATGLHGIHEELLILGGHREAFVKIGGDGLKGRIG